MLNILNVLSFLSVFLFDSHAFGAWDSAWAPGWSPCQQCEMVETAQRCQMKPVSFSLWHGSASHRATMAQWHYVITVKLYHTVTDGGQLHSLFQQWAIPPDSFAWPWQQSHSDSDSVDVSTLRRQPNHCIHQSAWLEASAAASLRPAH